MRSTLFAAVLSLALCAAIAAPHAHAEEKKKIVFIAGNPSHEYGGHEHNGGCMLLAKRLNESGLVGSPGTELEFAL